MPIERARGSVTSRPEFRSGAAEAASTGRRRRDDAWLVALIIGCAAALVGGWLAVSSAVDDLRGDTRPVVAATWAATAAVLLVGLVGVVAWRGLTGRRRRELETTRERFRTIYGASPVGIVETDLEQRIVACNASFAAMVGLEEADLLGRQGWEVFHPDSPPPDVAAVQDMITGVRASHSAVRLLRSPDGSPLSVKLDWAAITDSSGAVTQLACVVTDLSEQARTAAELARAQERAEVLWQQASIGVIEGTPEGVITSVNEALASLLGYRPEDLIGTAASALADPAYVPAISDGVAQLRAGQGYVAERRYLTADGRSVPVLVSTAVIHDEKGAVDRLAGFVVDMSELHDQRSALTAARDEVVRRQSFTDALLETLDVGIVSCAADGSQISRNRVQREMFGIGADDSAVAIEEVAEALEILHVDGSVVDPADYPITSMLDGRDAVLREMLVGPSGGPYRRLAVRSNRITSPEGTLLGAVSALSDVTAERHATQQLVEEHGRLAEAQRLGQLGSFTLDVAEQRFTFSDEMYRIWGLPPGADLAALSPELVHPDDVEELRSSWASALAVGGRHTMGHRIVRPDGTCRHLRVELDVDLAPDGTAQTVRGTHLDVTDLVVARMEAADASVRLSAILTATPDFTFVTDVSTGAVVYAPPGKSVLGITSESLMAQGAGAIAALIHPDDQPRLRAANGSSGDLVDGEVLQLRYRVRHTDGGWGWFDRRVTPFRRDAAGAVSEVLGVLRDVTDVVEAQSKLEHSALHDHLTGLPNRALLKDRLEAAMVRATRTGRHVAVLFCDLDGFKRVNDAAGHRVGDAVLVEATRRISSVLRGNDTVARVGGDEFVIVVEPWQRDGEVEGEIELDDRAVAVELAARLGAVLREPVEVDGIQHVVTASIGLTYAGAGLEDAENVLRDADAAMYRAKRGGKDRFAIFEQGLRTDLDERGHVEQVLRRALAPTAVPGAAGAAGAATLVAAYQPIVDAATGTLVGFEALARLTGGEGEVIAPDVFIPVAEGTGMIRPLGIHMLDRACGQLARWRAEVPDLRDVTMAVNISSLHAQHACLLDDVRSSLEAHGLAPSDLVLELTESSLLQAANSTLTALQTLRNDGVGIAIDDFGTGYASLRYLATLPVTAVKVDRSFTAGLPDDPTCETIVRAVVGLAADLHLGCVVEGVETTAQRSALPSGVQLQGYLIGRPAFELDLADLVLVGVP